MKSYKLEKRVLKILYSIPVFVQVSFMPVFSRSWAITMNAVTHILAFQEPSTPGNGRETPRYQPIVGPICFCGNSMKVLTVQSCRAGIMENSLRPSALGRKQIGRAWKLVMTVGRDRSDKLPSASEETSLRGFSQSAILRAMYPTYSSTIWTIFSSECKPMI